MSLEQYNKRAAPKLNCSLIAGRRHAGNVQFESFLIEALLAVDQDNNITSVNDLGGVDL